MTTKTIIIKGNKLTSVSDLELVFFLKEKGVKNTFRTFKWGKLELNVDDANLELTKSLIASELKEVVRGGKKFLRIG